MRASRRTLESGAILLRLAGSPEPAWRQWLGQALPEPSASPRVLVDLRDVSTVDSATLGALLSAARRLRANGGGLHLLDAGNREVTRLLRITGLDRCFYLQKTPQRSVGELAAYPAAPVRAASTAKAPSASGLVLPQQRAPQGPRQRTLTRL